MITRLLYDLLLSVPVTLSKQILEGLLEEVNRQGLFTEESVKQKLQEYQMLLQDGKITEEEYEQVEQFLLNRLRSIRGQPPIPKKPEEVTSQTDHPQVKEPVAIGSTKKNEKTKETVPGKHLKRRVVRSKQSYKETRLSDLELDSFMRGLRFPANKEKILDKARSNGASEGALRLLNALPSKRYQRKTELQQEFSKRK